MFFIYVYFLVEMNRDYVSQAFKGVEELVADGKAKVYSLNGVKLSFLLVLLFLMLFLE